MKLLPKSHGYGLTVIHGGMIEWGYQLGKGRAMTFTPRDYADMAIYLASDLDLGNASQGDLDDLAAQFLARALVESASFEIAYADGSTVTV